MSDQGPEAHLGSVPRYALAAASFGAGLIHVTAVLDHTEHAVVFTFFVVLAVVQVAWAVAMVRRPNARLLRAGAVISAGVVVIWLLSRTTGLAGVPGAQAPEAFGLKDGIASLLEVALVAGIAAQFVARAQGLRLASSPLASALAVAVVGILTATGLAASGHGHHHGAAHDHSASAAADHGHGDEDDHGDEAHGPGDAGHTHEAAPAGQPEATHAHGTGAGDEHPDGHEHHSSSLALAAGLSDHDHNAPGHVHHPSHHHAPGHVHDPAHHHAPGHADDPLHQHGQAGHSTEAGGQAEPGHDHGSEPAGGPGHDQSAALGPGDGHDHGRGGHHHGGGPGHGRGDHHHGGGDPGEAEACTSPLPANQVVTTLQGTAQSAVGAGCQLQTSSLTGDPHRHSPPQRSTQPVIS